MDQLLPLKDDLAAIAAKLRAVPHGKVRCFFGVGFEKAAYALDEATEGGPTPPALLLQVGDVGERETLVDATIRTLADIALKLWPLWYGDADLSELSGEYGDAVEAHPALLARVPGLSAIWLRRVTARVRLGRLPLLRKFPRTTQLKQLSLAIHRGGLVFGFAVADEDTPNEALAPLVHAAEWIAHQSAFGVALLLPESLADRAALARVTYEAVHIRREASDDVSDIDDPVAGDADQGDPAVVTKVVTQAFVGPLIGKPNPKSKAELRLAGALARDAELAPLFTFNVHVDTVFGNRPLVDLLWAGGGIVIEVDGYRFHSDVEAFARDRRRDYELILSGFLVLRLVSEEVVRDVGLAVEMIRRVVRFRRTQNEGE